jgi:dephospho-CoA kinase
MLPKLLIIGHGRHGKDTFAEILRDNYGLKFISSSQAAADIFIYDELKEEFGYKTSEECYADRSNHRALWYDLICEYNWSDRARLAKGILEKADCYVGMRDRGEIEECMKQGLFDLIVWVDASERLPLEPADSFNIDKSCADIIVDNNGTEEQFKVRVMRLGKILSHYNRQVRG